MHSYILFKTTVLKSAVKSKFVIIVLSKSKSSIRTCRKLIKNIGMSSHWLRVALLLSDYLDPQLSRLFHLLLMIPDNQESTVHGNVNIQFLVSVFETDLWSQYVQL